MSHSPASFATIFSQVDVTASASSGIATDLAAMNQTELLREVLTAQDRTNELLEGLVDILATNHKQRMQELHQWRNANPKLSERCRKSADMLGKVQTEYLERITEEIADASGDMECAEFALNEFVDRFGPRLAHLNGVISVLAQLGAHPHAAHHATH